MNWIVLLKHLKRPIKQIDNEFWSKISTKKTKGDRRDNKTTKTTPWIEKTSPLIIHIVFYFYDEL